MTVKEKIEEILLCDFSPVYLEVDDQSDRHIGHAGHDGRGESHFHVTMTSAAFNNVGRVQRQRMVYHALDSLLKDRVHALGLTLNGYEK